ncbi:hypothetical protein CPB83DRAFT_859555 [Crepidotus variabilis]|uniref:Uncharacterized protein n=1 Tax=Crepidotus variabilis TaxID=179855 RepID=A0A9P6EAM6_9AGAR|nr:hypothetical protein CPB83DRAFT_859555 [Crepidotus variabilis]
MAFSDLSQELIDEIIDHASDTRTDLLACSLSWRCFRPRCQFHLFKTIWIQVPTEDRFLILGSEVFEKCLILKTYVRCLQLFMDHESEWNLLYENDNCLQLMKRFCPIPDLRLELVYRGGPGVWKPIDWTSFAKVFWQPFIAPGVTTIILDTDGTTFPFELIFQCSKLRSLSTSRVSLSPRGISRPLGFPVHHLYLTSLRMTGSRDEMTTALLNFRDRYHDNNKLLVLNKLKKFDHRLDFVDDFYAVDEIIVNSTESLELLRCRIDPGYQGSDANPKMLKAIKDSKLVSVARLPAFKHLEFEFTGMSSDHTQNPFLPAAALIHSFSSISNLSRIAIKISLPLSEESRPWMWLSRNLEPLDMAIFDLGQTVRRQVKLEICVEVDEGSVMRKKSDDGHRIKDDEWESDCIINLEREKYFQCNFPFTSSSKFVSRRYGWKYNKY